MFSQVCISINLSHNYINVLNVESVKICQSWETSIFETPTHCGCLNVLSELKRKSSTGTLMDTSKSMILNYHLNRTRNAQMYIREHVHDWMSKNKEVVPSAKQMYSLPIFLSLFRQLCHLVT
jgi:hypothetical protein